MSEVLMCPPGVRCRSACGGAAGGGERLLHGGVAELAGAGRAPRRRHAAPPLPAASQRQRGPDRPTQRQRQRVQLQVRVWVLSLGMLSMIFRRRNFTLSGSGVRVFHSQPKGTGFDPPSTRWLTLNRILVVGWRQQ